MLEYPILRKRRMSRFILQRMVTVIWIVMNIEAFEKREQMLKLRERVLKAEQERIEGQPTMSVSEARRRLRERANEV